MSSQSAQVVPLNSEATLSMRLVRGLTELVESAGIQRTEFLRAAQLTPGALDAMDARLPRSEILRLCELALDLSRDSALGLHWGERLTDHIFTPVSHLVAHSATLRQAFEAVAQFRKLITDECNFELSEEAELVHVRVASLSGASPRARRFATEMCVVSIHRLIRSFGVDSRPVQVDFEYDAPEYAAEYRRIFGELVRFGQPCTRIVFDRQLMNAVPPHKDDDVHDALQSIALRRISRLTQRTPYSVRVHEYMVQQGPQLRADMGDAAQALGMSVRSLRRRLDAEGKTFHAIANDALATIAKHLLRDKQRTIQEVAYEMGFSDASAFHRAFKRWTGLTPRAYVVRKLASGSD
jgi:AraC-like DNA-binding protein